MLTTEYKNRIGHSYLQIMSQEEKEEKLRYQYRIVTGRMVNGLLSASLNREDGQTRLCYEVTGMQNLAIFFQKYKMSAARVDKLFSSLKEAVWSMEQYLLDFRNLILNPAYIFLDLEAEEFLFLYVPYYVEKEENSPEGLFTFLLECTDEKDDRLLEDICALYTKWEGAKQQCTAETLVQMWEKTGTAHDLKERDALPETMECTEYFAGIPDGEEKTVYSEAQSEREERKLFGNGKMNRKVISLERLPLVIGKKGDAVDVVLQDASVSRIHARITECDGQIYLEDMNAVNGTFKNGVQLKPYEKVEIYREDEIRLGRLEFTYR